MIKVKELTRYLAPKEIYGGAITEIIEGEDGKMWASNGEYATQINFCPFTGKKADVQMSKFENNTNEYTIYKNE